MSKDLDLKESPLSWTEALGTYSFKMFYCSFFQNFQEQQCEKLASNTTRHQ